MKGFDVPHVDVQEVVQPTFRYSTRVRDIPEESPCRCGRGLATLSFAWDAQHGRLNRQSKSQHKGS